MARFAPVLVTVVIAGRAIADDPQLARMQAMVTDAPKLFERQGGAYCTSYDGTVYTSCTDVGCCPSGQSCVPGGTYCGAHCTGYYQLCPNGGCCDGDSHCGTGGIDSLCHAGAGFPVPTLSVPDISVQTFSLPDISVQTFSVPDISVPTFSVPDFSIATFSVPDFSVPTFSVPDITFPTLSFSFPTFSESATSSLFLNSPTTSQGSVEPSSEPGRGSSQPPGSIAQAATTAVYWNNIVLIGGLQILLQQL